MERVKFYSDNDITCGHNLRKSEKLLEEYQEGKEIKDINYIIEIYNVKKFLDNKVFLSDWTDEDIKHYGDLISLCFKEVAIYINLIKEDKLGTSYKDVERIYKDDFWELIEKFKVYENVSNKKFKEFIYTSKVRLHELLKHKKIVNYFGEIIREYMHNDNDSAEILLNIYEMNHINTKQSLYLPRELDNTDKETIINVYIDSEKPNLNYIRLIVNMQSSKDKIEISPKILLKAKRKAESLEKQLFPKNSGMLMETTVSFSGIQSEEFVINVEGQTLSATYSKKWIEENKDFPTLLNNFIYLFGYVDGQMRSTLVNKYNNMGVFERFLITRSKNAYIKGTVFDRINALSLLQMIGYYSELFSVGIRLEEIIEWFFDDYLSNEFDGKNFSVRMPSVHSTVLEKCTNIMPAMESVLKQFSLFVQEGEIDYELLDIRSEHLIYKKIPSLIEKKYIYGIGEEFSTATNLLFSDQSGLGYYEKTQTSYDNFFELLGHEKMKQNDYPEYFVPKINWLIEHRYLSVDTNGYMLFRDKSVILILKDLYFNDVVCYWKYSKVGREIIDDLQKNKIVIHESSLLSKPEQDYFNYILNKSQFNNGLDLRNKYSHTQPYSDIDENMHNQNYMIFLQLFIVAVIKINDEFCTFDDIKKSHF